MTEIFCAHPVKDRTNPYFEEVALYSCSVCHVVWDSTKLEPKVVIGWFEMEEDIPRDRKIVKITGIDTNK